MRLSSRGENVVNDEGPVSSFSATDSEFCLQFCIKLARCSASSGAI